MKNGIFPLLLAGGAAFVLFSGKGKSKGKGTGTETDESPDSDVRESPGGQGNGEEPSVVPGGQGNGEEPAVVPGGQGDVPGKIGSDGPEVSTTTGTKKAAATGSSTKGTPITPKSEPKPASSKPGAGKTAPKKPSSKPSATKPSATKPSATRPSATRPSATKPSAKPKAPSKSTSTGSTTKVPKEIARAVQQALMTLGYSLPRYGADGDWGNETKSAMRNFQKDQSLPQTGTLTTETISALDRAMHIASGNKDEMCFSIDECNDLIVKGAVEARLFQPIVENSAGQAVRGVLKKVDLLALAQAEAYFDRHGKWPWE